jgi:hypothetical protein
MLAAAMPPDMVATLIAAAVLAAAVLAAAMPLDKLATLISDAC